MRLPELVKWTAGHPSTAYPISTHGLEEFVKGMAKPVSTLTHQKTYADICLYNADVC
jgi:hypothetical protein